MYDNENFICSTPLSKYYKKQNHEFLTSREEQNYKYEMKAEQRYLDFVECLKEKKKFNQNIYNIPTKDQSKTNLNNLQSSVTTVTSFADYSSIEKVRKLTISDNDYGGIADKSFLNNADISVKSTSKPDINYRDLFEKLDFSNDRPAMLDRKSNHGKTILQVDVCSVIDISDKDQLSVMLSQEINETQAEIPQINKSINFDELTKLNFGVHCSPSANFKALESFKTDDTEEGVIEYRTLSHLEPSLIHLDFLPKDEVHLKVQKWLENSFATETVEKSSIWSINSMTNVSIESSMDSRFRYHDNEQQDIKKSEPIYDMAHVVLSSSSRKEFIIENFVNSYHKKIIIDEDGTICCENSDGTRKLKENARSISGSSDDYKLQNLYQRLSRKDQIIREYNQSLKPTIEDFSDERGQMVKPTNQSHVFRDVGNLPKSSSVSQYSQHGSDWSALNKSTKVRISKLIQENQALRDILQNYQSSSYPSLNMIEEVEARIASNKENLNDLVNCMNKTVTKCNNHIDSVNFDNNRLRDIIVEQSALLVDLFPRQTRFSNIPRR